MILTHQITEYLQKYVTSVKTIFSLSSLHKREKKYATDITHIPPLQLFNQVIIATHSRNVMPVAAIQALYF